MWPAIQFFGGIGLIVLCYALVVFERQFSLSIILIIFILIFATAVTCCQMLAMGYRSIIISKKILNYVKQWNSDRWTRKFFKSCPLIAIRVGEFHKMDGERVPSFIRFVLQRTFFLVVKTK